MLFGILLQAPLSWLEFFNYYENLFMIFLTLVYMISSFFFVISAYQANKTSEAILKEMQIQRHELGRPYVHFNIQMDLNRSAYFSLNNFGKSMARDIQLKFHQKLMTYENWNDLEKNAKDARKELQPQITKEIDFLAPENQFVEFIGSFPLFYHAIDSHTVSGELTYADTEGHRYAQTFEINLEVIGKGYVLSKASQFVNDNDLIAKFLTESLQPTLNTATRVCEVLQRKLK